MLRSFRECFKFSLNILDKPADVWRNTKLEVKKGILFIAAALRFESKQP